MLGLLLMASAAFAQPGVPDGELAGMRGGMALPGGLTLALGVDIRTMVDGQLALRSVYQSDGPDAGLHVSTGAGGPPEVTGRAGGSTVSVTLPDFAVQQMIGNRIGAVVSNSGDNRVIETTATISADVGGLAAQQIMSGFALDRLAASAARH